VGTAQQPGRQAPLTGNQARKDLIESDSPERENAKAKDLESTPLRLKEENEGKRPEGPGETGPKEASVP
ncbi:hypothetical protein, partial [Streptomyces sp. wa1064]|uniref:hypothetical protein n=1 Tax=Streptomyces sp. wa1064 TaxID=1828213 RepID=UPI003C7AE3F8